MSRTFTALTVALVGWLGIAACPLHADARTVIIYIKDGVRHDVILNYDLDCDKFVPASGITIDDCFNFITAPPPNPDIILIPDAPLTHLTPTLAFSIRPDTGIESGSMHVLLNGMDVTESATVTDSIGGVVVRYYDPSLFTESSTHTLRVLYDDLSVPPQAISWDAPVTVPTMNRNEVSKVMVGLNGNNTIQAVELKMLGNEGNLLTGGSIRVYDASGSLVVIAGAFTGPVANGIAGGKVLCATRNFATIFGIEPDLFISPGLLVGTGQVAFQMPTCFVNALAYGAVTAPMNGSTSAPTLLPNDVNVLVRTVESGMTSFCPLSEDAAAHFQLVPGTSLSPVTFTNNTGASVAVYPTATGVDGNVPEPGPLSVYPNPFQNELRIAAPRSSYVTIYDVSGRTIRSWGSANTSSTSGPMFVDWDGTDDAGHRLPSGIYFIRHGVSPTGATRIVLLR